MICVSGTTASGSNGQALHAGDAAAQASVILDRIGAALSDLGAGIDDVIETRIYLTDIATWQDVGRIHGEVFKKARPATTIVQVGPLVASDLLVEISAVAILSEGAFSA